MSIEDIIKTDKNALTALLKKFVEKQQKLQIFDDYENKLAPMIEGYQEKIRSLDNSVKPIAEKLLNISNHSFYLLLTVQWKIYHVVRALIRSLEDSNPISIAIETRALLEHIALYVTVGSTVAKLEERLKDQSSEIKIIELLDYSDRILNRAYYGRSPKIAKSKDDASIHINDLLKNLSVELVRTQELYNFLCEYVHPNYGSNKLISSGIMAGGNLNISSDDFESEIKPIKAICSLLITYLMDDVVHMSSPLRLQMLLDRCFTKKAKFSNVFSVKNPEPDGNGKTKETAFYFSNARTKVKVFRQTFTHIMIILMIFIAQCHYTPAFPKLRLEKRKSFLV